MSTCVRILKKLFHNTKTLKIKGYNNFPQDSSYCIQFTHIGPVDNSVFYISDIFGLYS